MKNLIITPLPIVYIGESMEVSVLDGIDLTRCHEIYGIQIPVVVDYHFRTVFINKVNGPEVNHCGGAYSMYNLELVRQQAITMTIGWRDLMAHEHIACVRDLMSLKAILPLFNATIAVLRANGITAEEIRDEIYWALGDDAWNLRDATQVDLFHSDHYHPYSVDMRQDVPWFNCVKDCLDARWRTQYEDQTPRYPVRSCYMLSDEPEHAENSLIAKVIAECCGYKTHIPQPDDNQQHIERVIPIGGDE